MRYKKLTFGALFYCVILWSCDDKEEVQEQPEIVPSVETLAGGKQGLMDGSGADAQFYLPSDIALASNGDLYVIDQDRSALRKISSTGNVTTIFARYPKELADLAITSDGEILIAGTTWIGKLKVDGSIEMIVDGFQLPSEQAFYSLTSMAIVSDGTILLFETGNYRIINISVTGQVIAVLSSHPRGYPGGERNGKLEESYFQRVEGIYASETGEIFFSDWLQNDVRKISVDKMVTTVVGLGYGNPFSSPSAITGTTDGRLYLIDAHRIVQFDRSGKITPLVGNMAGYLDAKGMSAQFFSPLDMAITKDGHTMYVSDANNNRIRKVSF